MNLEQFLQFIDDHRQKASDIKRRDKVLSHLKNMFSKVEKNSVVDYSGISLLGLSPHRGGIEVNVSMDKGNLKSLAKQISKKLRGNGLEIALFSERMTPTIHGRNDRSGIPVRISFGDPTSDAQVELLSRCKEADPLVEKFLAAVNIWVLHRSLDETGGALSSFAWNILALLHLRREGVLLHPFSDDPEAQFKRGKRLFNVGIVESSVDIIDAEGAQKDALQLFLSFADWLKSFELPAKEVLSLRNPEGITRKDLDWQAPDLSRLTKNTAPPHLWPLMHPFDFSYDLSSTLTVEGASRIISEANRVATVSTPEEVFEIHSQDSIAFEDDKDLFEDLRQRPSHEVKSELSELKKLKEKLSIEVDSIREQRQSQIRMVQVLRGLVKDTKDLDPEHRQLLKRIPGRWKEINELKARRDDIHHRVVLSTQAIEEEILRVYRKLVELNDEDRYPSPKKERSLFSQFLELQVMHGLAVEATECHQQFVSLIQTQNAEKDSLQSFEDEKTAKKEELISENPGLAEFKGQYKELKKLDKNIADLHQKIRDRMTELREMNREIGRLEAWLRIDSKKERSKSKHRGSRRDRGDRRPKVDVAEAKRKASSGESMTVDDLDALLSSGGLSSLNLEGDDEPQSSRRRKNRKQRRISPTRSKRGDGRPDIEGRSTRRRD